MGLLASGVTVITVRDPGTGQPRGMTANAVMSVSLRPPLIVASVRRDAHLHGALDLAGAYGVTVLGAGQEGHARRFAGLPVAAGAAAPVFADRDGVPVLRGGLAWVTARVTAAHLAGDHTLFVAEVTGLGPDQPDDPPLAFHRSAFARVGPAGPGPALPIQTWETGLDMWG
jgi:flavin reductase